MEERTLHAVYLVGEGFLTNRRGRYSAFVNDFKRARLFNQYHHAERAIAESGTEIIGDVRIIPIKIKFDPQDLFVSVLGFK